MTTSYWPFLISRLSDIFHHQDAEDQPVQVEGSGQRAPRGGLGLQGHLAHAVWRGPADPLDLRAGTGFLA